jgi:lipoprotein-anchoring transpeptidase ErfK/SrfK
MSDLRSMPRRRIATVSVLVLALIVTIVVVISSGKGSDSDKSDENDREVAAPAGDTPDDPGTLAPTTTLPPGTTRIATSKVDRITAYNQPSDDAAPVATLSRRTDYDVPRTFMVVEGGSAHVVAEHQGWLRVLLPIRPNGTTGWIKASQVEVATTTYSMTIQLGTRQVTVYDGEDELLQTDAVVGSPQTPTPLGTFYVTDPLDLQSEPDSTYGAYMLGLSGFSEVLEQFEDGPAQIGLHGTNHPEQVGQEISNGCIRVPNDVIVRIAQTVPVGTPVHIVQ